MEIVCLIQSMIGMINLNPSSWDVPVVLFVLLRLEYHSAMLGDVLWCDIHVRHARLKPAKHFE
jgi:hypothetical protein